LFINVPKSLDRLLAEKRIIFEKRFLKKTDKIYAVCEINSSARFKFSHGFRFLKMKIHYSTEIEDIIFVCGLEE
jgi:hypothetical protein